MVKQASLFCFVGYSGRGVDYSLGRVDKTVGETEVATAAAAVCRYNDYK